MALPPPQGTSGNDSLSGGRLGQELNGRDGDDTLRGGMEGDTLIGGMGNDLFYVDTYPDVVVEFEGQGMDTVVLERPLVSFYVFLNVENLILEMGGVADGNDLDNIVRTESAYSAMLTGQGGNDTVIGGELADTLEGSLGNDSVVGDGGDDILRGQEGNDSIDGGAGNDQLEGGAGNDTYWFGSGDAITESTVGGGHDRVISSINITLSVALEDADLVGTAANATGNDIDNRLVGNDLGNLLQGGRGADTLAGNKGNDTLNGGTGADLLIGGQGNDTYHLGTGDRIQEVASGGGHDTVLSSVTSLTLDAALEDLELVGTAAVGNGNNTHNRITGNAVANELKGGQGNDTLIGMGGNDTLVGGKGRDLLTGGDGHDTFRFTNIRDSAAGAPDLITDLLAGDRLDFSVIDADSITAGDQAFTQVSAFSGQAGQLVLAYDSGNARTSVSLDADGDAVADLAVLITGLHTSTVGWLL